MSSKPCTILSRLTSPSHEVLLVTMLYLILLCALFSSWTAPIFVYNTISGDAVQRQADISLLLNEYTLTTRDAIRKLKENKDNLTLPAPTPFINLSGQHRLAPKYNLAACLNEKVMCTLTQAILCYLFDTERFIANKKDIYLERWYPRFCQGRNEVNSAKAKHLRAPKHPLTLFMVRDPIEKFLSGYSNKCMLEDAQDKGKRTCYGCLNGDVLCAVQRFHSRIMMYSSQNASSRGHPSSLGTLTYHVLPSIWRCEMFDEYKNYFFVKYGETPEEEEKMWKTLLQLFRVHGVEDTKLKHISEVVHRRSLMATKSRKERVEVANKLKASKKHMDLLREVYFYDFIVFGYPLP